MECGLLEAQTAELERSKSEVASVRDVREAEACSREEELSVLQQQIDALHALLGPQRMVELSSEAELRRLQQTEGLARQKDDREVRQLQLIHNWHKQHHFAEVRQAATAAERDGMQASFVASGSSSSGNGSYGYGTAGGRGRAGSKRSRTSQQRGAAAGRTSHSMRTIGGY